MVQKLYEIPCSIKRWIPYGPSQWGTHHLVGDIGTQQKITKLCCLCFQKYINEVPGIDSRETINIVA